MTAIIPRTSLTIRPAVAGDLAFIDALQQMHSKAVGFMPTKQLEQKIARGEVLIAQDAPSQPSPASGGGPGWGLPIGYCIASDRYFKRDEVGIIYQMNVSPSAQRKLVAASLLREVFDRAAYGCKLFCCWCAQDLAANYFWESMGFVPLAFRTGAHGKKGTRTHIFWQKRIREGDCETPFWFPAKTDAGSMRADRLVLPIPPGVSWTDEMPVLLPAAGPCEKKRLPGPRQRAAAKMPQRKTIAMGGLRAFQAAQDNKKPERQKKPKLKVDPKHVAAARELRDRYLEQFNSGLVLPQGKYEVSRALAGPATTKIKAATGLLSAA